MNTSFKMSKLKDIYNKLGQAYICIINGTDGQDKLICHIMNS